MRDQYRRLSDREIREEGITLIKNAIKAQHLAEPLIMSYLDNKRNVSDKNWGCYMVQQSIELSIKGIIKYYYSDFIEGHFLKDNAEILDDLSNVHHELRELNESLDILRGQFSATLYKWESTGRYKELYVNDDKIRIGLDVSKDIFRFIRKHELNLFTRR